MDVLGFGGAEIVVILILAAIVLGPERMARAARTMGQLIRDFKSYFGSLNEELKAELEVLDEVKEIKKDLNSTLR